MFIKNSLFILFLVLLTTIAVAQVPKTLNLNTAGTLSSTLSSTEKSTVTNLTLSGNIDARDIQCMQKEMAKLAVLDISSVRIITYTTSNGLTTYPANGMPEASFIDRTSLTSINLPTSLVSIGMNAFYGCSSLKGSLIIPSGVTSISSSAFWGCTQLTEFIVQGGNNKYSSSNGIIYNLAQDIVLMCPNGKIGNPIIQSTVKTIGNYAFYCCSGLTGSLMLPGGVINIGYDAFSGCSGLTGSLTIPNRVKIIDDAAFSGCSGLTGSLIIPDSVTRIGYEAFNWCTGLTSLYIGNGVSIIDSRAFNCSGGLKGSLTIPNSVVSIGSEAFSECRGLTGSLTIPGSVTNIGSWAFFHCGFNSIYSYKVTPVNLLNSISVFYGLNLSTCKLYVPIESRTLYQAADQWKDFLVIEEIPTATISPQSNNLKISVMMSTIIIDGSSIGEIISFYNLTGNQIQTIKSNGERIELTVQRNAIYIVKTGTKAFKVII